jgi:small subunit ribosomal protein S19
MARSQKKGPFVDEKLFRKVQHAKEMGSGVPIRTWARRCTIVPEFIGQKFEIHNGKMFVPLYVTEDMVGHKLGEFSPTRTFKGHSGTKKAAAGAPA